MEFSKASTIKYVRAVGTYDESELADAMTKIEDEDMQQLYELTRKLHCRLQSVRVEAVESKKSKNKSPKLSPREKLCQMIRKIELALDKYESTADVDAWEISLVVGEGYYNNQTFEDLKEIHDKLINTGCSIEKLRLLNFVERGRLYAFLKNSDKYGSWKDVCMQLDVCRRTVDRYIDFYNIISAYPRLMICELTFEMILSTYKQLNEYFSSDESLMTRLQMPLKTTRLSSSGVGIVSSRRLPGGGDEPQDAPQCIQSEGASWDPAWPLIDKLLESHDD
jgi:hypothetical protein